MAEPVFLQIDVEGKLSALAASQNLRSPSCLADFMVVHVFGVGLLAKKQEGCSVSP